MSIVKRSISIKGAKIVINEGEVQIQGKRESLSIKIPPQVKVIQQGENLLTKTEDPNYLALTGTINSLIFNALKESHKKTLEVKGVGYKAFLNDNKQLELHLGFSHPIKLDIPTDLEISCSESENKKIRIDIRGANKQRVGWFAAKIHDHRRPSAYKEKGVYYEGEKIRLKAGKSINK